MRFSSLSLSPCRWRLEGRRDDTPLTTGLVAPRPSRARGSSFHRVRAFFPFLSPSLSLSLSLCVSVPASCDVWGSDHETRRGETSRGKEAPSELDVDVRASCAVQPLSSSLLFSSLFHPLLCTIPLPLDLSRLELYPTHTDLLSSSLLPHGLSLSLSLPANPTLLSLVRARPFHVTRRERDTRLHNNDRNAKPDALRPRGPLSRPSTRTLSFSSTAPCPV